jgi:hypothetical protein
MWAIVPDQELAGRRARINQQVPLGRVADPSEIAHPDATALTAGGHAAALARVPVADAGLSGASGRDRH